MVSVPRNRPPHKEQGPPAGLAGYLVLDFWADGIAGPSLRNQTWQVPERVTDSESDYARLCQCSLDSGDSDGRRLYLTN